MKNRFRKSLRLKVARDVVQKAIGVGWPAVVEDVTLTELPQEPPLEYSSSMSAREYRQWREGGGGGGILGARSVQEMEEARQHAKSATEMYLQVESMAMRQREAAIQLSAILNQESFGIASKEKKKCGPAPEVEVIIKGKRKFNLSE